MRMLLQLTVNFELSTGIAQSILCNNRQTYITWEMSDKDRVCIEVFHRDELSIGEANRGRYGLAIYHWAILIRPKDIKRIGSSTSYDTTDGVRLDPHFRDLNPNRDWWFRTRSPVNPLATGHFLGAVVIGKLPKTMTIDNLEALLARVALPRKCQTPDENCATWIQDAIRALQQAGCAEQMDVAEIMRRAMDMGDQVLRNGRPKDSQNMFKNVTSRPD